MDASLYVAQFLFDIFTMDRNQSTVESSSTLFLAHQKKFHQGNVRPQNCSEFSDDLSQNRSSSSFFCTDDSFNEFQRLVMTAQGW